MGFGGEFVAGLRMMVEKREDPYYAEAASLLEVDPPPKFRPFQPSELTGVVDARRFVIREAQLKGTRGIRYTVSYPPLDSDLRISATAPEDSHAAATKVRDMFDHPEFAERFQVEGSSRAIVRQLVGPELRSLLIGLHDHVPELVIGSSQIVAVSPTRRTPGAIMAATVQDLVRVSWMITGDPQAARGVPAPPPAAAARGLAADTAPDPEPDAPEARGDSPEGLGGEQDAQLAEIFAAGPLRARAAFDGSFAGRSVVWAGTVRASRPFSTDLHFGDTPGVKTTVAIGEIDVTGYGTLMIDAIVGFPASTELAIGQAVTFEGTLLKLDGLTRDIYITDGSF